MLANTLTITIDGAAKTLTRINQDNYGSEYRNSSATGETTLLIRNTVEKATASRPYDVMRHNLFLEEWVYATPTTSEKYFSTSAVFRRGRTSDPAYLPKLLAGFTALVNAQAVSVVAGEV